MNVTVGNLAEVAKVLAGRSGLGRRIHSPQVTSPDLGSLTMGRAHISGVLHIRPSQLAYLCSLPPKDRIGVVRALIKLKPACLLLTGGRICRELLERSEFAHIPVLKSTKLTQLSRLLADRLAPHISLHGVLVQIFGLGTLIIGESAVGKSEAALDLVLRGHKLTADDMVIIEKTDGEINGKPTEMGVDLLQIRGLGIIDVRALYGESATVSSSRVGLVVELEEWKKGHQYSLVGLRERRYRLLGVNLPYLKLPVKPGRNMATLIEVAARNQMLKNRGIFTARDLNKRLLKRLSG
ncbi:MAG TPA: HPr(Ser) kinase/phosphatase [Nitrospirota bacterium]|nr:HPr(Ser) kinase/phosphatase [Nitrospirota bacterium]